MLNARSNRINRSWYRFTVADSPFEQSNGEIAKGIAHPSRYNDIPQLDKAYLSGEHVRTGKFEGPVPGVPMQELRTAAPGNVQRNRTGPVSTRDLIAALIGKQRGQGRTSSAGQSAFT